ncbi:MAG TPA: hypothetical protein VNZ53_21015 [Steroidobacteraceae bacterium]|nr:hypothetical protein [Steroidobacteraceae bacterium]
MFHPAFGTVLPAFAAAPPIPNANTEAVARINFLMLTSVFTGWQIQVDLDMGIDFEFLTGKFTNVKKMPMIFITPMILFSRYEVHNLFGYPHPDRPFI